jgi:hypothetical protein
MGIGDHKQTTLAVGGELASVGAEKAVAGTAGKVLGKVVQPAIWIIDNAATGSTPDAVDVGLYGLSFAAPLIAGAALVTGVVKAIVDDDTERRVKQAAASEPESHRPYIKSTLKYGWSGQTINAQVIASEGGTAWLGPSGVWVYITDAKGRLVCDYKPNVAKQIYQPVLPLSPTGNGKFRWHSIYGGA